jgi:hypothetical protein
MYNSEGRCIYFIVLTLLLINVNIIFCQERTA